MHPTLADKRLVGAEPLGRNKPPRPGRSCDFKCSKLRSGSLALFLLLTPFLALAQQPEAASSTAQAVLPEAPDTTPFVFAFALSPERNYPANDTLPDLDFRMYDPARRGQVDWGTLGNIGSSARPLFFDPPLRQGFDPGFHAFDLYQMEPAGLQFYRNTRAFTDLFFSQGRIQNDNTLRARFSRTFAGGLNFSLDYHTFNHLGQYRYQAVKHNSVSMGVWYPAGPRYECFLIFTKNTDKQQENGGIVTDTVFGGGQFSGPIDAQVRLPDEQALTHQANWSLHWTHHLKFTGVRDSSAGKRVLRATHSAQWTKQTFKFSDPGTTAGTGLKNDSLFYDTFLVDLRGIRHYWELQRVDNTFTINTFKAKKQGRPSDLLALGLRHTLFALGQEPRPDSIFSNLFLLGNLALTPSDRFSFLASGSLGALANFGEYQISGELKIGFGKGGEFRATLVSQRYPPAMLNRRLFVSQRLFWQNDFEKPVETSLSASYTLPAIGLELSGKTHLVNNYLYFNQDGVSAQTGSPLQVVQLILRENIRWGPVRLDNTVALQHANRDDVLRLPEWFTRNSLYFSGNVFKKRMLLEGGVDFRLNSAFTPDGYQPVTAQFHLQDSLRAKPFPWLDLFVSFKVQSFRFFVRYENLSTFWDDKTVYYQSARYPQPFGSFRFGVGWRFLDSKQSVKKPGAVPAPGTNANERPLGPRGN